MNIYVGNLSYATTEATLRQTFEAYGQVESVNVIQDRETGRSKGFGFVVMPNQAEADAAIAAMNEKDVDGRRMRVNEARPRTDAPTWNRESSGGGRGERRSF